MRLDARSRDLKIIRLPSAGAGIRKKASFGTWAARTAGWAGYANPRAPAYEGAWKRGPKIHFLPPEGEGMFRTIEENRPYDFISIRLGTVKNGTEDTQSEEARR